MADEPTNGELARRLDDIFRSVQGLVGQAQYGADQRRIDDGLESLRRDLAVARADFTEDIRDVHQRVTDEAKRAAASRQSWRTVIYTGLIPGLVAAVAILVQIWLHGGKQ